MKTKLLRFTAVLSAMLCMICCVWTAVPAFALTNSDLPTGSYNPEFEERYKTAIAELKSKYPDKFKNYVMMLPSYDSSYSQIGFYWINCDNSNNFEVYEKNKSYYIKNTDSKSFTSYRIFLSTRTSLFSDLYVNGTSSTDNYDYGLSWQIYDTNCNVKFGDKYEFGKSDAPIIPFSVQYSRKLTTGMSRSGTLSAPGAKNDGETITNNNIDITVKLTDEYKQAMQKALDKDPKATQYTYQYVLFITPYDPNIYGTKKAMDGAIYTFLDKSKYVLTTAYGKTKSNTTTDSKYDTVSTPDSSATDTSSGNVGEMTSENADGVANSAFCNGVTPLFGLPIASGQNMTNTHTINLENIKGADKLGEQDILYIVVVGKRYLYETGAEGYAKDFYANNAEFKTFYKELPDNAVASKINGLYGGNGYDFYTVVSDGFSFKDYPDYKPLEINGVEYPTDKSISDMLDDPFPPSKFTDYDGLENGTDFDTKEDFDDYINNKKYDEQYGTFNFNLTDISSIFDGSSDFFKFMTASIGILPPIFITILIAFFTIMLAICLVKWVVK